MKLNKTLKALLATSVLAAAACTANYEDINRNPYEVSGDEMDRDGYAMRSFLTTMQSWVVPTDVNQCQFTDILLAGVYGGYFADANADFNSNSFATYLPATNWSEVFYETIYQRIIANYFELLDITTDENAIAVAKVIKVMGLSRVADVYGPIPYTALGTDVESIPLDSEETVYRAMFADLNEAIAVLTANRTQSIIADADRLYGGSLEKWCKLANSLKLRLAMRVVYADETLAREMAESAVNSEVGVMTSNDDNAMYTGFGKDGNPFYVCFYVYKTGKGDHKVAADISSYMNGYSDPRRSAMLTQSTFSGPGMSNGYVGLRRGITVPSSTFVDEYSSYNVTSATSIMWMNASETSFLRAEGRPARLGDGRRCAFALRAGYRPVVRPLQPAGRGGLLCRSLHAAGRLPRFGRSGTQRSGTVVGDHRMERCRCGRFRGEPRADHHPEVDRQLPARQRGLGRVPPHGLSASVPGGRQPQRRCRPGSGRTSRGLPARRVRNQRRYDSGCGGQLPRRCRPYVDPAVVGLQPPHQVIIH